MDESDAGVPEPPEIQELRRRREDVNFAMKAVWDSLQAGGAALAEVPHGQSERWQAGDRLMRELEHARETFERAADEFEAELRRRPADRVTLHLATQRDREAVAAFREALHRFKDFLVRDSAVAGDAAPKYRPGSFRSHRPT